jgi:hypothetical protein
MIFSEEQLPLAEYFLVWILRDPPLESGKYSTSMQYLSPGIGLFRMT